MLRGTRSTTQAPFPGFCSDDAAPPGGYGSRVYGPLAPGSYRLIGSGFSAQQVGPFVAQVKFAKACVPVCGSTSTHARTAQMEWRWSTRATTIRRSTRPGPAGRASEGRPRRRG